MPYSVHVHPEIILGATALFHFTRVHVVILPVGTGGLQRRDLSD
jgi:hypothetical protein